ncbi:glycosyltransferase [Schleiferiaceae bacterium]|nr:glycosyltransferase [Schleiferiaceae bacterium]
MLERVLFLGPRMGKLKKLGGVVILFEDLLSYTESKKIDYDVIDTNLDNYSNRFIGLINIALNFISKVHKVSHVSLHGTARDFSYLAPVAIILSNIYGKRISLRKFGGNFHSIFESSSIFKKSLIKFVLRNGDYVFFETLDLVDKFSGLNSQTFWWPNSRPKKDSCISERYDKKFVFISQVKVTKGVEDLIQAASKLDSTFEIDIYGPIIDDNLVDRMCECPNLNYKGTLLPEEVTPTLVNYDILILPTYHEGEGYPGIILEAFSLGMPVISTKWNAIPEIVSDCVNGLLVPVRDSDSLVEAIRFIDQNNFVRFRENAIKSFDRFDSELVNEEFFSIIKLNIKRNERE